MNFLDFARKQYTEAFEILDRKGFEFVPFVVYILCEIFFDIKSRNENKVEKLSCVNEKYQKIKEHISAINNCTNANCDEHAAMYSAKHADELFNYLYDFLDKYDKKEKSETERKIYSKFLSKINK